MIRNRQGSALLISMLVLTLVTVMSTVFFEKIKYFSEASNGIENSNVAYYKALGVIENSLFAAGVNKYTPWNIANTACTAGMQSSSGACMKALTGATSVPAAGKGNSPYDPDYNIIALGEPVQLVVPEGLGNWGSIGFYFRIPQISPTSGTGVSIIGSNSGYILWTLASSGASLFASGETNIFQGNILDNSIQSISIKNGTSNSGSNADFGDFYQGGVFLGGNGANCTNFQCTLKLSLIRPVPTSDAGRSVNFLEYKITGFPSSIPSQYMTLSADGYAYGFMRNRTIRFPQITTNTALDFAVLQ